MVEQRWLTEGGAKPRVEGANGAARSRQGDLAAHAA